MPHMYVVLLLCIRSWLFETCSYSYDTKSVQYLTNGFVGKSGPGFKRVSTVITNCGAIAVVICELPMAGLYGIICGLKGVADCGADVMGYTGVFSPMQRKKKRG